MFEQESSLSVKFIIQSCTQSTLQVAKIYGTFLLRPTFLIPVLGFKAKAKPNLLKQETHSLATALRILFRLSGEEHESQDKVFISHYSL